MGEKSPLWKSPPRGAIMAPTNGAIGLRSGVKNPPLAASAKAFAMLVQRLANTLAFERRCIRSGFVAQVRRTLSRYAFTCAPCRRGASTLSMRQAICETLH